MFGKQSMWPVKTQLPRQLVVKVNKCVPHGFYRKLSSGKDDGIAAPTDNSVSRRHVNKDWELRFLMDWTISEE